MRRFFTDKKLTVGTEIVLDGEEAKHIMTVLRMKPGDELLLINGTGREMTARILNENKGEVRLEAISDAPCPSEPLNRVTLFQCLPKAGKLELIIQKCVELGIFAIQLRCETRSKGVKTFTIQSGCTGGGKAVRARANSEGRPRSKFE